MDRPDLYDALLEVTYTSTTDPRVYGDLVTVWERYMGQLSDQEVADQSAQHASHFTRALDIFARMGRRKQEQDSAQVLLDSFSTPAYLVDENLMQVQANPQGHRFDGLSGKMDLTQLRTAIRKAVQTGQIEILPVLDGEGTMIDCAVISPQPPADSESEAQARRCMVVLSNPPEASPSWTALCSQFDLSAAEATVLRGLLDGKRPESIAQQRGVSLPTVRTQIRQLLDKTGAGNTLDLIRHCLLISNQIQTLALSARITSTQDSGAGADVKRMLTPDGRVLAYRDFGTAGPQTILFFHNMMGGTEWPERMQEVARQRGWRVIAPSRPGFGVSDSYSGKDLDLMRRTCADARALMNHLGIEQVVPVGLMSSAGLAAEFARTYPTRTRAALTTGHAGLMDDQMIEAMTNPARTMAKTYRKSPIALRFLIRVAVASVDLAGPEQMMRQHLSKCPEDSALLDEGDTLRVLCAGLRHAIAQGGEAFSRDGYVALTDFSDSFRAIPPDIPVVCLLGKNDPFYPIVEARRLIASCANYRLHEMSDAGQYAFYTNPAEVFDLLDALWRQRLPAAHAAAPLG